MNLINLFIIFLSLNAFALSQDEEKKYDELEGLSFIKALIQDKKYEDVLKYYPQLKQASHERQEFHYYAAEANYQLKRFSKAFDLLQSGSKKPTADYLKLWGRTASHLKKYDDCSELYKKVKPKDIQGEDWKVFFQCLSKNNETSIALNLALTQKLIDLDFQLVSQEVLIKNGLHLAAETKREIFLGKCQESNSYFRMWATLEKVKLRDMRVLETAHACHPAVIEITSLFIKNLFVEGHYHSIAYIFETLSVQDVAYIKHSAEFYKVAGRGTVADYFFTLGDEHDFVLNQSARFLNQENYAGLLTIPFKSQLLSGNKDLAYALAYSQFKYLNLSASLGSLEKIDKRIGRDVQLANLIEQCRSLDWKCRP